MNNIFFVIFLLISSNCIADQWVFITASDDEDFYVNPSTIRGSNGLLRVWELRDVPNGLDKYPEIKSFKSHVEYDCIDMKYKTISSVDYSERMGGGNGIYSESASNRYRPIVPDTVGEDIYKYVCNKK